MSLDINSPEVRSTILPSQIERGSRVLAVEFEVEGHHAGYVQNFAESWVRQQIPAYLDFLVTPRFFALHANVVEYLQGLGSAGVRIMSLTDDEYRILERTPKLRYFQGWRLYCEYAKRFQADHGLIMYFDFFQVPSLFGPKSPCRYSGIYFRPTFHYHTFQNYVPTIRESFRAKRKSVVLGRVLRDPQLERLYCLDCFAVDYIKKHFPTHAQISLIADSFAIYDESPARQAELRVELGIEPDRIVFCLLGVLDRRKGVKELLECLPLVDSAAAKKICLLLAGRVHASQEQEIKSLVARLQQSLPMQIILQNEYIDGDQVQHYYELSDVILATYQGHMGSSSALIRAALAQKPILSSDYGLMGEIVLRRRLGLAVDTTVSAAMAKGIQRFVEGNPQAMFDHDEAWRYAQENSPEQLAHDLSAMVC